MKSREWLPYTKDLKTRAEVLSLVRLTGKPISEVVFLLLELWSWFDTETADGFAPLNSVTDLSSICHGMDDGFTSALQQVGWLREEGGGLRIPNFDRYMGSSAKRRLENTHRQRQIRQTQPQQEVQTRDKRATNARQKSDKSATTGQDNTKKKKTPYPLEGGEEFTSKVSPEEAPRDAVARRVIAHYDRVVRSPYPASGTALVNVRTRLAEPGASEALLCLAADLYARCLAANGTRAKSVQGCSRFYGPSGAYLGTYAELARAGAAGQRQQPPQPPPARPPDPPPLPVAEWRRIREQAEAARNGIKAKAESDMAGNPLSFAQDERGSPQTGQPASQSPRSSAGHPAALPGEQEKGARGHGGRRGPDAGREEKDDDRSGTPPAAGEAAEGGGGGG